MAAGSDNQGEVGRGRPPLHSRFAKGKSGNPAGRPKKDRDLRRLAETELDQPVWINEAGKRVRLTKREIIIKKLVNDAAKGEHKALRTLLSLIGTAPEPDPVASVDPAELARFAMRYLPQAEPHGTSENRTPQDGEDEQ